MKRINVIFLCALIAVTSMLFAVTAHASTSLLPWLDFGSNFRWDSNTHTLSDGGMLYVSSVTYLDGSTTPPPWPPADDVVWSQVFLSLSFDGDNTNDKLTIKSGDGTIWFSAFLDITSPAPDPLAGTPNPYSVMIKSSGLTVADGMGSRWADEFDSTIDYTSANPAQLNIGWTGSYKDLGDGIYRINAAAKINVPVIPEPVSTILFITGGGIFAGICYRKKIKLT